MHKQQRRIVLLTMTVLMGSSSLVGCNSSQSTKNSVELSTKNRISAQEIDSLSHSNSRSRASFSPKSSQTLGRSNSPYFSQTAKLHKTGLPAGSRVLFAQKAASLSSSTFNSKVSFSARKSNQETRRDENSVSSQPVLLATGASFIVSQPQSAPSSILSSSDGNQGSLIVAQAVTSSKHTSQHTFELRRMRLLASISSLTEEVRRNLSTTDAEFAGRLNEFEVLLKQNQFDDLSRSHISEVFTSIKPYLNDSKVLVEHLKKVI